MDLDSHIGRRSFFRCAGLTLAAVGFQLALPSDPAEAEVNYKGSITIQNKSAKKVFVAIRSETNDHVEHYTGWYGIDPGVAGFAQVHVPVDTIWICAAGHAKEAWKGREVIAVTAATVRLVGKENFAPSLLDALEKGETLWFAKTRVQLNQTFEFADS